MRAQDDLERASEALESYAAAQRRLLDAQREIADRKALRARAAADVEAQRAQCLLSGEVAGGNAEARAAALTVALARLPAYVAAVEAARALDREIAHQEARADEAVNEMRRCRLVAELVTALVNRDAAVHGGSAAWKGEP